jgi:hypothetical protein
MTVPSLPRRALPSRSVTACHPRARRPTHKPRNLHPDSCSQHERRTIHEPHGPTEVSHCTRRTAYVQMTVDHPARYLRSADHPGVGQEREDREADNAPGRCRRDNLWRRRLRRSGRRANSSVAHRPSRHRALPLGTRDMLTGLALVGVTAVSLAAGAVVVLPNVSRNLYPANTLLRQLVLPRVGEATGCPIVAAQIP